MFGVPCDSDNEFVILWFFLRLSMKLKCNIKKKKKTQDPKETHAAYSWRNIALQNASTSDWLLGGRTATSLGWDRKAIPSTKSRFLPFFPSSPFVPVCGWATHSPSAPALDAEGSLSTFPGGSDERGLRSPLGVLLMIEHAGRSYSLCSNADSDSIGLEWGISSSFFGYAESVAGHRLL